MIHQMLHEIYHWDKYSGVKIWYMYGYSHVGFLHEYAVNKNSQK